jgi:hypothetical protein
MGMAVAEQAKHKATQVVLGSKVNIIVIHVEVETLNLSAKIRF